MPATSSYSRLSYLAIKQEVTENTAVTPDVFIPFISEDIVVEYQPTPAMPVSANRVKNMRPVKTAIPAPTGTIALEIEPKTLGWLLKGIYGTVVSGPIVYLTSVSGAFTVGETVTGGTSSATATVLAFSAEEDYMILGSPSGPFTDGETITGGTSAETAVVTAYDATVIGHEFKAPQQSLPTFTVEFGYANEAIRYTGVILNSLSSLGQNDNKITAEIGITARAEYKHAKVTAITTSGAGAKTITLDQTTGLVAGDTIKVWREGTGFLDFVSAGVKTHTIATVASETSITVTNLQTALAVGDRIVIAPQTPTYDISKEFFWIGGSVANLANSIGTAVTGSPICIEDFTAVLTNEIEPRHCANGVNVVNRFPSANFLKGMDASGSINKTYRDIAQIIDLRDSTQQAVVVKCTGQEIGSTGRSETFEIRVPNLQFNNFNPSISEDALLEQNIEYTCYDDPTAGYFHKALLVNDEATY